MCVSMFCIVCMNQSGLLSAVFLTQTIFSLFVITLICIYLLSNDIESCHFSVINLQRVHTIVTMAGSALRRLMAEYKRNNDVEMFGGVIVDI